MGINVHFLTHNFMQKPPRVADSVEGGVIGRIYEHALYWDCVICMNNGDVGTLRIMKYSNPSTS